MKSYKRKRLRLGTYYSNCCLGIRTGIKSALRQRNRIYIYQYFQLKLATKTHAFIDEDS